MNCSNCGAVNQDGSQWCGICGKALKRKKAVLIVFSVILLLCVPANILQVFNSSLGQVVSYLSSLFYSSFTGAGSLASIQTPFYLIFLSILAVIIRITVAVYIILSLASAISALITATKNKSAIISKKLGITLVIVASLYCIATAIYSFVALAYIESEAAIFILIMILTPAIVQTVYSVLFLVGIKRYNGKS